MCLLSINNFMFLIFIVDGDCIRVNSSAVINFADFENVADAFTALMRIFTEELHDAKFETIRTICLARADKNYGIKLVERQVLATSLNYLHAVHSTLIG